MGLGGSQHSSPLRTFGWANDPRFHDVTVQPQTITSLGNSVYMTLVPAGQLNQHIAKMRVVTPSPTPIAGDEISKETTDFGVGFGRMMTLEKWVRTGDFNNDGLVDDNDFQIFAVAYDILDFADASMPAGCPADITRDGLVDDTDFTRFVVAYDSLVCP